MVNDEDEGGIAPVNIIQLQRVSKKLDAAQNAKH